MTRRHRKTSLVDHWGNRWRMLAPAKRPNGSALATYAAKNNQMLESPMTVTPGMFPDSEDKARWFDGVG